MIDDIHKLGRIILGICSMITIGVVITINPDIEIDKLMAAISVSLGYVVVKGTGNKSE